jgi:hypothetical protein
LASGNATLNGTLLEDRGFSASCYFEYGLTVAYGSDTSASPATCSTGDSFSYALTGLTPGATYHYRAVAVSVLGTVYGDDVSFSVPISAAVVETVAADITGDRAMLNGLLVYDGGEACIVGFEYGCSLEYGSSVTCDDTEVSAGTFNYNLTGLIYDTCYHVRAFATNKHGTVYGRDASVYISKRTDSFGGLMGDGLVQTLVMNG